jgi:hypothetical protein
MWPLTAGVENAENEYPITSDAVGHHVRQVRNRPLSLSALYGPSNARP